MTCGLQSTPVSFVPNPPISYLSMGGGTTGKYLPLPRYFTPPLCGVGMATTISERWTGVKNQFTFLPPFVRRLHRIVGAVWVLSLAVTLAVPAAADQLPGPSIPGLSFIALLITGSYLLIRPWIRGNSTAADRWGRLKNWDVSRSVLIRRVHRVISTILLVFIGIALGMTAVGAGESPLVLMPIVGLLLVLIITGGYMFFRPWVNRIRSS